METDWLKDICEKDAMYPLIANPWSIDFEGAKWAIASQGHVLVALKAESDYPALPDDESRKKILELMQMTDVNRHLDLHAFRKWIDVSKAGCCPYCSGSGKRKDVEEDECGDPIWQADFERIGKFCGVVINRVLLEIPLANIKDGIAKFSVKGAYKPIEFIGIDWRISLMPMRPNSVSDIGIDSFGEEG